MLDFLTNLYLFYTFVSLYFLTLFILIYFQNRNLLFYSPVFEKELSLSIVIPCYNEADSIGDTIQHHLSADYKGLKKIFVVDDCSKDNSYEIIKKYAKLYPQVIALQTPKNTGCAAGAKNFGAKFVKTDLIGFSDGDSFPKKDAISNMVGFFNDETVGGVTSRVLVRDRNNLLEKLQSVEYKIIAFTRKLFGFVGGIYVTNGPLSIYRKKAFDEVNGFDEKNLTEDIEITWHFVKDNWKVQMSLASLVYTVVPSNLRIWFKQRIRWNVGGIQTIMKYKKSFLEKGMLGSFILPFFGLSWVLAVFGLCVLVYRVFRTIIVRYLSTFYSVQAQTTILRLQDINLSPSILFLFGIFLFVFSLSFNLLALSYSREKDYKGTNPFQVGFFMFFYLLLYPIVLITSSYKFLRGYNKW